MQYDSGDPNRAFADELCAVCCGKIHPGSVRCCTNVRFPSCKYDVMYISLFSHLTKTSTVLSYLMLVLSHSHKEPCTNLSPSSVSHLPSFLLLVQAHHLLHYGKSISLPETCPNLSYIPLLKNIIVTI